MNHVSQFPIKLRKTYSRSPTTPWCKILNLQWQK